MRLGPKTGTGVENTSLPKGAERWTGMLLKSLCARCLPIATLRRTKECNDLKRESMCVNLGLKGLPQRFRE